MPRWFKTYGLPTATALCLLLALPSCGFRDLHELEAGEGLASLVLRAGQMEGTRSGEGSIEEISTLRIVILRPDGTVEHNAFHDDCEEGRIYTFKVQPGEAKKIVLITNEYDSFGTILSSFGTGSSGFLEAASQIVFEFDDRKSIPMTGVYNVPAIASKALAEHSLHVVRAATKFSFDFINRRPSDVVVSSMSIDDLASRSYLLPRFTREGIWRFDNERGFVADDYTYGGVRFPQWELWLKRLVDNQGVGTEAERAGQVYSDLDGWILDYDIPAPEEQSRKHIITESEAFEVGAGKSEALGEEHYYAESKNLLAHSVYMSGHEQTYSLNVTVGDKGGVPHSFTRNMPNLRGLFRNTHVLITISFGAYGEQDEVYARIEPWVVAQEVDGLLEEEEEGSMEEGT